MADRVLKVNAFTTLDLVTAEAEGHGFLEEAYATLNVRSESSGDADPAVELELELDNTELDELAPHADRVTLSPAQARTLAAELERRADRIEEGQPDA